MKIQEKLEKLREEMKKEKIDVYIVPTDDFHQSEYVCEYFQVRRFLSGFSGSAGTLVVTMENAALFTDGRYFVQAQRELEGTGIELMKMGVAGVPELKEYVDILMRNKKCLGFDGRVMSLKSGMEYEKKYELKTGYDLADRIWDNRPKLPESAIWVLDEKYCGVTAKSKLTDIRDIMRILGADYHLITSLDDIAWIFNIRGNDIAYNPVTLAYAVIGQNMCVLFVEKAKIDNRVCEYFEKNNICIQGYDEIYDFVRNIQKGKKVLIDDKRINYALYKSLPYGVETIMAENPSILMKAIKNSTEIQNERMAHIKDGVAVTRFMYWLKKNIGKIEITECSAAEKLEEFRKEQEGYLEPSFETISAYNANAAMMHYSPFNGENAVLQPQGALLVDSGGQYMEGTTDITRTIGLGAVSDEFKRHYTAVVRGMLRLADARFLHGCIGMNLDILAREPLWEIGMDYRCGTGHGVGYLLNVHEAPNGFRWKKVPERDDGCVLEVGMITTDEPGVYIEGKYGIRIENELVVEKDVENEYGCFLKFSTLTMAPIDMEMIYPYDMEKSDWIRLENYHNMVYQNLQDFLDEDEKRWFCNEFLVNMS